jgi:phosphoribosyl-AMP cyclohydrolase
VELRSDLVVVAFHNAVSVHPIGGAACHDGYQCCFFRHVDGDQISVVGERLFDPKQVYKK